MVLSESSEAFGNHSEIVRILVLAMNTGDDGVSRSNFVREGVALASFTGNSQRSKLSVVRLPGASKSHEWTTMILFFLRHKLPGGATRLFSTQVELLRN